MAVHLMSGLDRDQYAPSVIVLGERCGSALEMLLQTKGIPIIFLGKQPGFDPRTFVSLHRALQRSGQTLYIHMFMSFDMRCHHCCVPESVPFYIPFTIWRSERLSRARNGFRSSRSGEASFRLPAPRKLL